MVLDLPESIHESSDYVELSITANVFYRVKDPKKVLETVQAKNIEHQIKETAISTLAGIIRSTSLAEIAQNTKPNYTASEPVINDDPFAPSAPPFYQRVHDMFLQELHDYVLKDWGIEINNIRIESLKIKDDVLSKNIAKQAITVSQLEVKYGMLQKQAEITETETRIDVNAKNIKAEGESQVILQKTNAEANSLIAIAEAKKRVKIMEGEAEAESLIKISEAKKQEKIMEGEGGKSYLESISVNEYGPHLAQLNIQKDALSGMQQIAYMPQGSVPKLLTQGMFSEGGEFSIPEISKKR